jgi:hypothetical protein
VCSSDLCNLAFNRSFDFLFRKFYSVNIDVFYSLFHSFCSSFYGAELWINRSKCSRNFKQLSVSYHAALKKILGVPKVYSNHFTCNVLNVLTFENFINLKCLKFLFWLSKCNSPCFLKHKFYFLNLSLYVKNFSILWSQKYDVLNTLDNDFNALLSRIKPLWVECSGEAFGQYPRSLYP